MTGTPAQEVNSTTRVPPPDSRRFGLVDLTLLIAEDLPCFWPTHQPFQHKTWNWFTEREDPAGSVHSRSGPYATRMMVIDEHTGTHLDAPSHFVPPAGSGLAHAGPAAEVSVDRVGLEQAIGAAVVVDVSALDGTETEPAVSPLITAEVIESWEAGHGRIQPGEVVLLHTGWDRNYRRGAAGSRYLHDVVVTGRGRAWPAPDVSAVRLLLDRGVRCIGTDGPTIGPAQGEHGQAVHVEGLAGGAVFVECLTNLDRLPPRGAWFCFLPLKIEGGTGAPGRAVAWLPPSPRPSSDPTDDSRR